VFLRRFFEPTLAQASYLIGCMKAREAIVIDPNRDAEPYIQAAKAEGARITHVTETHIHADFLSGSRELAARTGATIHLSDDGDAHWKYDYAKDPNVRLIKQGSRLTVGNVVIDVLHTPGHTPEHLTFLVTDTLSAPEPIAAVTGDFVFVGDVGRPDLLERAANVRGTMEQSARTLFQSLRKFAERPDWLQIWPGHGAGSSCGKGISAIPHSTLGYERRFNWAFRQMSEDQFVKSVLTGQPDPPKYFAEMKRLNKAGPRILSGFPKPPKLGVEELRRQLAAGVLVIDTRPALDFASGHVPGTINIPHNASFTNWAGWFVPYDADFSILVDDRTPQIVEAVTRLLAMIGLDRVTGWFDAKVIEAWMSEGKLLGKIPQVLASDLQESMKHGAVTLLDVRNADEWNAGHIPGAIHIPLGALLDRIGEVPKTKPVVVQCQSGSRSSIGASLLGARGIDRAINLIGGINEWRKAGLTVTTDIERTLDKTLIR
jgi:hydroxyacylglutathione hydrolase